MIRGLLGMNVAIRSTSAALPLLSTLHLLVPTATAFSDGFVPTEEPEPEPEPVSGDVAIPTCPADGSPAECCDPDGSCTDGDDDWCCGGQFYCSNFGEEYAKSMGGILCPSNLKCVRYRDTLTCGRVPPEDACITDKTCVEDTTCDCAGGAIVTACTWLTTTDEDNMFECADGTTCTGSTCCNDKGGRARCPPNMPYMCAEPNACADGSDHCCEEDCSDKGGVRKCTNGCTWLTTTDQDDLLECRDGTTCSDSWACCNKKGGRARCPPNKPVMCANPNACADDSDFCCQAEAAECTKFGGVRECLQGCTWLTTTNEDDLLECRDGSTCFGENCCNNRGGRARCPPNMPLMCAKPNACADGQDYCCDVDCTDLDYVRECVQACTWLTTTKQVDVFECRDGTTCFGELCCVNKGGLASCPSNLPFMCAEPFACAEGQDYCCKEDCNDLGGVRKCPQACSWHMTTDRDDLLECRDGTKCAGETCCMDKGGPARCPPNMPDMCADKSCAADCSDKGVVNQCSAQDCTWLTTTDHYNLLGCKDGNTCMGWDCCNMRGGRARCPPNRPYMCAEPYACANGADYCCDVDCRLHGGVRECEADCTWLITTDMPDLFECKDGTTCMGETCCNTRGGRARCPPNEPLMCAEPNACADGADYCCETDCGDHDGVRECLKGGFCPTYDDEDSCNLEAGCQWDGNDMGCFTMDCRGLDLDTCEFAYACEVSSEGTCAHRQCSKFPFNECADIPSCTEDCKEKALCTEGYEAQNCESHGLTLFEVQGKKKTRFAPYCNFERCDPTDDRYNCCEGDEFCSKADCGEKHFIDFNGKGRHPSLGGNRCRGICHDMTFDNMDAFLERCCEKKATCEEMDAAQCTDGGTKFHHLKDPNELAQSYCKTRICGRGDIQSCCNPNPTCNKYLEDCPTNMVKKKSQKKISCKTKNCDATDCCAERATCGSIEDPRYCGDEHHLKNVADRNALLCISTECNFADRDLCCQPNPTCGNYECDLTMYTSMDANTICRGPECDVIDCCAEKAQCSSVEDGSICEADHVFDPKSFDAYCAGPVCTTDDSDTCCFLPFLCKFADPSICPDESFLDIDAKGEEQCDTQDCNSVMDKLRCCTQRAECFDFDGNFCEENHYVDYKNKGTNLCEKDVCTYLDSATCCSPKARCTTMTDEQCGNRLDAMYYVDYPLKGRNYCHADVCDEIDSETCCSPRMKCIHAHVGICYRMEMLQGPVPFLTHSLENYMDNGIGFLEQPTLYYLDLKDHGEDFCHFKKCSGIVDAHQCCTLKTCPADCADGYQPKAFQTPEMCADVDGCTDTDPNCCECAPPFKAGADDACPTDGSTGGSAPVAPSPPPSHCDVKKKKSSCLKLEGCTWENKKCFLAQM